MVAKFVGAAMLAAGLALAGPAEAQGFSGNGAGGVAALRGATASPGHGGFSAGGITENATDGPIARAPEPAARPRRMAPTDVDYAPRNDRPGTFGLPF